MDKVHHSKTRRFKLCIDKVETFEDVKKILDAMNIRIDTDNPEWENVSDYFCLEVVPKGFGLLLDKIGWEGINNLHYNEIEQQSKVLLELENNEKES